MAQFKQGYRLTDVILKDFYQLKALGSTLKSANV